MTRSEESSELRCSGELSYRYINEFYFFLREMENLHQNWRRYIDEENKNIWKRGSILINKIKARMGHRIKNKVPNTTEIPYICNSKSKVTYSVTFSQCNYSSLKLQRSPKEEFTFKTIAEASVLQSKGNDKTSTEKLNEDSKTKLYSNTEKHPVVILERLPTELLEQYNYYNFEQKKQKCSQNDVPEIANKTESRISSFDTGQIIIRGNENNQSCKRKRDNSKYPYVKLVKLSSEILKQHGYVSEKDDCGKRGMQDKLGKNEDAAICDKVGSFHRGSIVRIGRNHVNEEVVGNKSCIESIKNKYCNSGGRKERYASQESCDNNNSFKHKNRDRKSDIRCDENNVPVTSVSQAECRKPKRSSTIQTEKSCKRNNDSYSSPLKRTKLMLPGCQNCADSNIRNEDKSYLQFNTKPYRRILPKPKHGFHGFPSVEETETSMQIIHRTPVVNMTDYKEQYNYNNFEQNKQKCSQNDAPEIANKTECSISSFDMGPIIIRDNEKNQSSKRERDNSKYPYVKLVGSIRRGSIVGNERNHVNEEVVVIKPSIESRKKNYFNSGERKKHYASQKSFENNNSFKHENENRDRKSDIRCNENNTPVTSVSQVECRKAKRGSRIQAERSCKRNNDSYAPPWKQTKLMLPDSQNCADSNIRNEDKHCLQSKIEPCHVILPKLKHGFRGFSSAEETETRVQIINGTSVTNMTDYKKKNARANIIRRHCNDRYQYADKVPRKNSNKDVPKIKKLSDFPSVEDYVCDITLYSMLDAKKPSKEIPAWALESSRRTAVETQSFIPIELMCKFLSCSNTTPNICDVF